MSKPTTDSGDEAFFADLKLGQTVVTHSGDKYAFVRKCNSTKQIVVTSASGGLKQLHFNQVASVSDKPGWK